MTIEEALEKLNESQIAAVTHQVGKPAMVIAGAGSGKTRVLTTRVAWLASQGVAPQNILLVTFTNKAAMEMIERVEIITGSGLPFAGTFHRICARILRASGRSIGVSPSFTIYDEDDQLSLMTTLMKDLGISTKEIKPKVILSMISGAKNELLSPSEYSQMARGKFQEIAARVYPLYQKRLQSNDALDFDDLLVKTVELLEHDDVVRAYYQNLFSHVLIDEYQDTNTAQLALTKLLVEPQQNLFVVGDFAQAIYSWRGADYRNMMSLTSHFASMVTYKLEQNYRSTQSILDAASFVIAQNKTHPVLSLWTDNGKGSKITLFEGNSDIDEVSYIIKQVQHVLDTSDSDDIAILYRTNAQSRAFEEGLLSQGIPYRLVGGVRFYARKEIKDLLAYLRLWGNPSDEVSMQRIQKLGKRKAQQFAFWLNEQRTKKSVQETSDPLTNKQTNENALSILDMVLDATQYLKEFDEKDEEDQGRLENIQELRSVAARYESLDAFLETVALVEEDALRKAKETDGDCRVSLMSIHAAKGLEFSHVFVVGLEEGIFPHSRSLLDPYQMEEERRLCYVAMTRAKNELTLSYARKRLVYGRISGSVISRFLAEIPADLLRRQGQLQHFDEQTFTYASRAKNVSSLPRLVKTSYDDPSIDDFLEGTMDVDTFLHG